MSLIRISPERQLFLLALLPVILLLAAVSGCVDSAGDEGPVLFVSTPVISGPPNTDTPLVHILDAETNVDTTLSVTLTAADHSLQLDFDGLAMTHSQALYGLRAGRDYTATLTATDGDGNRDSRSVMFSTFPLPDGFPTIEVTSDPAQMEPGYTLFNVLAEGDNSDTFGELLVIVDEAGEVVWYHRAGRFLDVRQLANGNIFAERTATMVELDMSGNTIRFWGAAGLNDFPWDTIGGIKVNTVIFHHEVFPMANGNYLALSIEARNLPDYPSSYDGSTAVAPALVAGDVIVEFQPDGTVVNEWKLLDMLDPYRIGYGSLGGYWDFLYEPVADPSVNYSYDWGHGNAVIHDPSDDSIIVSLRHQDALVKFSRATGDLIWILGPHDNWGGASLPAPPLLTPVATGGGVLPDNFWPYHPHAPQVMDNGDILVYDNGNWRASPPDAWISDVDNFSRAVQYRVNTSTMEVEQVWEYGEFAAEPIFSGFLGDADQLPQTNNVLITNGSARDNSGKFYANITEVTRDAIPQEVFQMTVRDPSADPSLGWRVYRSERIGSLYPPGVLASSP